MKSSCFNYSLLFFFVVGLASCGEISTRQNHGPIILGDSSTIVTETDATYLQDRVLDMEVKPAPEPPKSPEKPQPVADRTPASAVSATGGFTIDFGTVSMTITGIETTEYQQQDPQKDAGVSYARTKGKLTTSSVIIEGASEVKLQQRYQTRLAVRDDGTTLLLKSLGVNTSDWTTLSPGHSGNRFVYDLSGLKKVTFNKVSHRKIRNALEKELRRRRAGKSSTRKWINAIRNTSNAEEAPCEIILNNVQWRISGTDVQGRHFFKTVRLDARAVGS